MNEGKNNSPVNARQPCPPLPSLPRGEGLMRMVRRAKADIPSFLFVIIALCSCSFSDEHSFAAPKSSETRVIKVHDGDTVTLTIDGRMRKTRLIGIDAPEMSQRPWGRRAKEHLIGILDRSGWMVTVETDEVKQDKYDRPLVYLRTKDGGLINEQMAMDGYAVKFTIKPNEKYANLIKRAEQSARQEKKGIWGEKGLKEMPVKYREKHPREDSSTTPHLNPLP